MTFETPQQQHGLLQHPTRSVLLGTCSRIRICGQRRDTTIAPEELKQVGLIVK